MASFSRHGHVYRCDSPLYRTYVCLLPLLRPARRIFLAVRRRLGALLKRLGLLKRPGEPGQAESLHRSGKLPGKP
jgi:hypothetical protein